METFRSAALKIGVTSPLISGETPPADLGATQHCLILEQFGVTPILLRNDEDPTTAIERFALDGLIFSGGEEDISPELYGGDTTLTREADLRRDTFEFALMERVLRENLPIFAICRGMQVINVVLKGTLIEDLPQHLGTSFRVVHNQVAEGDFPYGALAHEIEIATDSLLYQIAGANRVQVNSLHHQAIGRLAPELRAVAHAQDGVIEAIEFSEPQRPFFLGVQWHPEWLPGNALSARLYERFIASCDHVAALQGSGVVGSGMPGDRY